MKISKILFGLDLVLSGGWAQAASFLEEARIKAGLDPAGVDAGGVAARRPRVRRSLHQEPMLTTCTLPCSWGSCEEYLTDWGNYNPWCTLCSDTPRAQEFTFTLDKGDKFRIRVERDLDQCMMDPAAVLLDAAGKEVAHDDDSSQAQRKGALVTTRAKYALPENCGEHGDPYFEYTPLETQVYTLKVYNFKSFMPCPREGYKYKVFLHYHNNSVVEHGFTKDPSCTEEPMATSAQAFGSFQVPQGTFTRNHTLEPQGMKLEARVRYEDKMAKKPIGNVELNAAYGDGTKPFFASTAPDSGPMWLFTNKVQECTRMQGNGITADGEAAVYDLIVQGGKHRMNVYMPTTDPNAPMGFPQENMFLYSTKEAVEFETDNFCISENFVVGPHNRTVGLYPRYNPRTGQAGYSEGDPSCACEPGCTENSDCEGRLVCYQLQGKNGKAGSQPKQVPGCPGKAEDKQNYCVEPTTEGHCHEQRDDVFLYSRSDNPKRNKQVGRQVFRTCAWLEKARKLQKGLVRRACAQTATSMNVGPAGVMCPITCQTCRPQCGKHNVTGTPLHNGEVQNPFCAPEVQ